MPDRLRKAWYVRPGWSDKAEIIFAKTASKARYRAWLDWRDPFPDLRLMDITVHRAPWRDILLPEEHRLAAELTPAQRRIVLHAYGAAGCSPGYRDHYCTAPGNLELLRLTWELGLFSGPHGETAYGETPGWGGAFFLLTALGKEVARSMLPTYPR